MAKRKHQGKPERTQAEAASNLEALARGLLAAVPELLGRKLLEEFGVPLFGATGLLCFVSVLLLVVIPFSPMGPFPYFSWREVAVLVLGTGAGIVALRKPWRAWGVGAVLIVVVSGYYALYRVPAMSEPIAIYVARFKEDPDDARQEDIYQVLKRAFFNNADVAQIPVLKLPRRIFAVPDFGRPPDAPSGPQRLILVTGRRDATTGMQLTVYSASEENYEGLHPFLLDDPRGPMPPQALVDDQDQRHAIAIGKDAGGGDEVTSTVLYLARLARGRRFLQQGEYREAAGAFERASMTSGMLGVRKSKALALEAFAISARWRDGFKKDTDGAWCGFS